MQRSGTAPAAKPMSGASPGIPSASASASTDGEGMKRTVPPCRLRRTIEPSGCRDASGSIRPILSATSASRPGSDERAGSRVVKITCPPASKNASIFASPSALTTSDDGTTSVRSDWG